MKKIFLVLPVVLYACQVNPGDKPKSGSPLDNLPDHISQITFFGQRAEFSHDSRKIMFMEKTCGDVYEYHMESRIITAVTHHFLHEGFTRVFYLSNGDVLLSGAREFDAANPGPSRRNNAELWVLDGSLTDLPVPLGVKTWEGQAVARNELLIAYSKTYKQYPEIYDWGESQIFIATIDYPDGRPKLVNERVLVDSRKLGIGNITNVLLEPQNFRPPDNRSLIFSLYFHYLEGENPESMDDHYSSVMEVDINTGEITRHTDLYMIHDEPEGIFPDGMHTLMESNRGNEGGEEGIDIWKLSLDGKGDAERLTWFQDYRGYKSSNPVVSDDGRYMAFQYAFEGDPPGVGRGLLIYDFKMVNQRQ